MKIRFKAVLTTALAAALLLTGCSSDSDKPLESQYDSHITFAVEGTSSEKELTEVAKQLEQRIERCFGNKNSSCSNVEHQMQTNHDDKTVTIYFNNTANLSSQFMEFTALPNKVEMRKGDKPDGELVLTEDEINNAQRVNLVDYETGKEQLELRIELTDEGSEKFKEATTELAQTRGTITIWLDGKAVNSPRVNEPITDGSCFISGIEDEQKALELGYRLRSGYIENKVTVKECNLHNTTESAE